MFTSFYEFAYHSVLRYLVILQLQHFLISPKQKVYKEKVFVTQIYDWQDIESWYCVSEKVLVYKLYCIRRVLQTTYWILYSKFFYYSEYKYVNTIGDVVCGLFLVQPNKDSPILLVALEKSQYRSRLEDPNHIVELFYQTSNTQK